MVDVVKINTVGEVPHKARSSDAAYDLRAKESVTLEPGQRSLVPTGFQMAVPEGYVGLVCSRSGLAARQGVFVLNAPGVIDPDYIGDVSVILMNAGNDTFEVSTGDRIAQLLIVPAVTANWQPVTGLVSAVRGTEGFGSSGVA